MTDHDLAGLEDIAGRLAEARYSVEFADLGKEHVLLAENPYALVACLEMANATHLPERVADAQAALTKLVATEPSPRRWDLYILVHLLKGPIDGREEAIVDEVVSDTRYSRKLIRSEIDLSDERALDRALRPLLPLESATAFDVSDPLEALRAELQALRMPSGVVSVAIDSFKRGDAVAVP